MRPGLGMHGDDVGAGLGEGLRDRGRPARSSGARRTRFLVCGRSALITGGPKVMLGTKCPSITSRWIQSAPGGVDGVDLLAEPREVGGEHGRRDDDVAHGIPLLRCAAACANTRLARMSSAAMVRQLRPASSGPRVSLEQPVRLPQPRAVERVADRARVGEMRLCACAARCSRRSASRASDRS